MDAGRPSEDGRQNWPYYVIIAWSVVAVPLFAGFGAGWLGFAITVALVIVVVAVAVTRRGRRKRQANQSR